MRMSSLIVTVLFGVGFLLTGCPSGDDDDDTSGSICDPGVTQQCLCPGGDEGVQVCEDDGSAWGTCDCGSGDDDDDNDTGDDDTGDDDTGDDDTGDDDTGDDDDDTTPTNPCPSGYDLVYETDFSSDPGWTTNNSSHYYWDSGSGSYHVWMESHSSEYAYKSVNYSGGNLYMEFDVKYVSMPWAQRLYIGLMDAAMDENSDRLIAYMAVDDQGNMTGINSCAGADTSYSPEHSPNEWYTYRIEYSGGNAHAEVEDSGGSVLWTFNVSNVTCTSQLSRFAASIIGFDRYSVNHSEGYIDNLLICDQ